MPFVIWNWMLLVSVSFDLISAKHPCPLIYPCVIGLLESDTMRIIMGNRDWAQFIAEDLGYYVDYVSTIKASSCDMI